MALLYKIIFLLTINYIHSFITLLNFTFILHNVIIYLDGSVVNKMGDKIGTIILILIPMVIIFLMGIYIGKKKNGGLHSNMMDDLLDQHQNLLGNSSAKLENIMSSMIKTKKRILDDNAEDLAYLSQKEAELKSAGVRTTAKAVKDGLTDNDTAFCKHCGISIDNDSKFCKKCGKEQ